MDQSGAPEPLLSDLVKINGVVTPMILTADGQLRWSDRCLVVEKEVLGFAVEGGSKIKIRAIVETGAGICRGGSQAALERKSLTFEPLSDDLLRLWCEKLQNYLDSLDRPKRLYVIVNPYGGKKSASKIFHLVKPLLEDANIEITVQETQYQLHAKEIVHSLELPKYDGIVCVSGDGILVEYFKVNMAKGYKRVSLVMAVAFVGKGFSPVTTQAF